MALALRHILRRAPPRARSMATAVPPRRYDAALPSGRVLGVHEAGAERGQPLLFLPDEAEKRRVPDLLGPAAAAHNIRLITLDRPGLGSSTAHPGRSLLDWAADVRCFAQGMDLPRFAVLGTWAGGPHALACARALPPGTVSAVGLCSSAAPWALTAPHMPWPLRFQCHVVRSWEPASIARAIRAARGDLPPLPPRREGGEGWLRLYAEAIHWVDEALGSEAGAQDAALVVGRDWGFALEDVDAAPVRMWHDTRDVRAPVAAARAMADRLPYATLREMTGEGLSLLPRHRDRIFAEMAYMMKEM